MSEYQYYEFTAVDRPLNTREQAELRSLSTRADITATSFVNTYEWGNFKGDPRKLMERYFDAHLYLTNWGTRELMLRLPSRVLDPAVEPPWIFRRENQLRSFLFREERGNGDGEAAQVVYCGI